MSSKGFVVELPETELDLGLCVTSGQVFRWERLGDARYLGVDGDFWYVVEVAPARRGRTSYRIQSNGSAKDFGSLFRLETSLTEIEAEVLRRGPELKPYVERLSGLRVLNPSSASEVLFSFLCTPNNNLERITRMVRALAEYGDPIGGWEGRVLKRFPDVVRIASIPEAELRQKGFGYRGATIPSVARQILSRGDDWLVELQNLPYEEAHAELCSLKGVGPKLADCICLIGLRHLEAVPVDTHLYQAACREYFPEWRGKALTGTRYREIGGHFRGRFGSLAGWAHQYLYYENLLRRRSRSPHNEPK
ncbi:MAG: hypothetical protein HZC36_08395 [Armatimonadetes bacterium]|nr:hypothetical protein [Armatimonadota bacterium]